VCWLHPETVVPECQYGVATYAHFSSLFLPPWPPFRGALPATQSGSQGLTPLIIIHHDAHHDGSGIGCDAAAHREPHNRSLPDLTKPDHAQNIWSGSCHAPRLDTHTHTHLTQDPVRVRFVHPPYLTSLPSWPKMRRMISRPFRKEKKGKRKRKSHHLPTDAAVSTPPSRTQWWRPPVDLRDRSRRKMGESIFSFSSLARRRVTTSSSSSTLGQPLCLWGGQEVLINSSHSCLG
jgi:hypothetical protein